MKIAVLIVAAAALCGAAYASVGLEDQRQNKQENNTNRIFGSPRMSGGGVALLGEFPYHAFIVSDDQFVCNGALISDFWVLTAASCVDGHTTFTIFLGLVNAFSVPLHTSTTRYKVTHEDYDNVTLINNIAVLNLFRKVPDTYKSFISPIALASGSGTHDFSEATLTTVGVSEVGYDTFLSNLSMTVIPNDDCKRYYHSLFVASSVVCAGATPAMTRCESLPGSPLREDSTKQLIGIASFATVSSSCNYVIPDGFTRITSYSSWLEEYAPPPPVSGLGARSSGLTLACYFVLACFVKLLTQ